MKTKHIAGAGIGLLTLVGQAGAETVGHEKYTYDAAGNIVEKRIDDQVTRFEYEGNILKSDNQGTYYRHDRAGRLTGESREGRVERKLTYQFGDKVTRVEKGGITTELFYNAEGQLVGKTSNGQAEIFAWDSLGLALRGDQACANEDHIVGGVPALTDGEVTVSDFLGSSLKVGERNFDATAFGEGLEGGLLSGKPFVEEIDGFVFKYRNYEPRNLRWVMPDPLGFPDGSNQYAYLPDPNTQYDLEGAKVEEVSNSFSPSAESGEVSTDTMSPISYSYSGGDPGNPGIGFWAKVNHTSAHEDAPSPNEVKVEVTFTADDVNQIIYYTAAPHNPYQATGAEGEMGITAKMSGNGEENITATVTGGIALNPYKLDNVQGVTHEENAGNVILDTSGGSGGDGAAFTIGGGNWKWAEN